MLYGELTEENIEEIKHYIINPVDSREAELGLPETLILPSEEVKDVETVNIRGRSSGELIKQYGLAMDEADMDMLKAYFADENREPTLTEIRVIDTYWSDHCRHTTFNTEIVNAVFEDEKVQRTYEEYLRTRESIEIGRASCRERV